MQQERSRTVTEEDARADWGILSCLVTNRDQRPWSVDELARERGDSVEALDAIDRLVRAGLLHRTSDNLVFPTRAALHLTNIRA